MNWYKLWYYYNDNNGLFAVSWCVWRSGGTASSCRAMETESTEADCRNKWSATFVGGTELSKPPAGEKAKKVSRYSALDYSV